MELVIFIGLQGAGKSSWYAQHFARSHVHVSRDRLRNNRKPRRRERVLVEEALNRGESVVVDNTHPLREERAALIELARAHGARVVGYYFKTDVETALRRNAARTGRARVPDVAVYATASRLEEPSLDEGYDALHFVEPRPAP